MMSISGHPESGPTRTGYFSVDMSTALNAAFAISAALFRRHLTGEGQRVDVSMLDTAVVMQAAQMSNYLVTNTLPELMGNRSPTKSLPLTYLQVPTALCKSLPYAKPT